MKHISGVPLLDRLLALPTNMQSRLEKLATDKRASLLLNGVSYGRKKFHTRRAFIKLFCRFDWVPAEAGFKPLTFGSLVDCSTNCRDHVLINFFNPIQKISSNNWILS